MNITPVRFEDTNPEDAKDLAELCQKNQQARNKGKRNKPTFLDVTEPITVDKKVGRNDPCPCGSKKKYKKCCI